MRVRVSWVQRTRAGVRYDLAYAGPEPAHKVADVFCPRMQLEGKIESHSDRGVFVLLAGGTGAERLEVVGLIRPSEMLRQERQHPDRFYPNGQPVRVEVKEVNPEQREIALKPVL